MGHIMLRRVTLTSLLTLAILLLGWCIVHAEIENQEEQAITFKGCSIIRRSFMSEAASKYEKVTGKKINVMGGGATLGIRAAAAGEADIGGACRPSLPNIFDEEKGVYLTNIAWDALVFITNSSNPINNITLQQAKDILSGKINNWKEVGGITKPIVVILRSQVPEYGGKLSGVEFMARLMLFKDIDMDFAANAIYVKHTGEVEDTVEKIPYSFSVTGFCSALKRNVKLLKVDGIAPTKRSIASGKYPLFRPLYLATKGKPLGETKKFIDWLLSKEGQQVVADQGAVNLKEGYKLQNKYNLSTDTDKIQK